MHAQMVASENFDDVGCVVCDIVAPLRASDLAAPRGRVFDGQIIAEIRQRECDPRHRKNARRFEGGRSRSGAGDDQLFGGFTSDGREAVDRMIAIS